MIRETSLDAWEAIADRLPRVRGLVFRSVLDAGQHGATADELVASADAEHHNTIAPRLTELAAQGYVVDSGNRRITRNGQRAIVWVVPSEPPPKIERTKRPSATAIRIALADIETGMPMTAEARHLFRWLRSISGDS